MTPPNTAPNNTTKTPNTITIPANRWNGKERVHPALVRKIEAVIEEMASPKDGTACRMMVVEGYRTQARQNSLYAQGRTKKGRIVTSTTRSVHTLGLAADCCFVDERGQPTWTEPYPGAWKEFVRRAERRGVIAGGSWTRFVDYPHVQLIAVDDQSRAWELYKLHGGLANITAFWGALEAEKILPETP